jgi:hypothetical protein
VSAAETGGERGGGQIHLLLNTHSRSQAPAWERRLCLGTQALRLAGSAGAFLAETAVAWLPNICVWAAVAISFLSRTVHTS